MSAATVLCSSSDGPEVQAVTWAGHILCSALQPAADPLNPNSLHTACHCQNHRTFSIFQDSAGAAPSKRAVHQGTRILPAKMVSLSLALMAHGLVGDSLRLLLPSSLGLGQVDCLTLEDLGARSTNSRQPLQHRAAFSVSEDVT